MRYSVEQRSRNIAIVTIPHTGIFEQRFLLTADRHWDNPLSDHELQIKHMALAKRYKAGILDFGDFFCAMQGKFDKRASKSSLRREHQVSDYLDALVNTATNFFTKYAKQFIMIGMGNHETSILKRNEVNLTNRLVRRLNESTGSNIYNGGYSGWVQFVFENTQTGLREQKKLWYIHGYGGGGPVTRGVIQSNRKAVYTPDADIVCTGHIHEEWNLPIARTRLNNNGEQYLDEQLHIQVPSYKDEYDDGYSGWHVETGKPPKPIGAVWLVFRKEDRKGPVLIDCLRAK